MKTLLYCERFKTKRRFVLLTALAITAAELFWVMYGNYSQDALSKGWMMFLYQLPLINAMFLPLLSVVVASRLCDIEHKGGALRQLCCTVPRGRLYDAKLAYGLGIVLVCIAAQFAAVYLFGKLRGFGGDFPLGLYLLYLLFTVLPAVAVYIFQHTLSLLFKNQAVPFFAGIIGEFCGVFSMFLPQLPWLRKSLLWGYFGVLQFVGGDYDKATRTSSFYVMDIDWTFFAVLAAGTVLLYLAGKKLFCEKEM